ncbi:MAG: hypothetical protein IBV53_07945 [Candidatus Atribacteria bacterium]
MVQVNSSATFSGKPIGPAEFLNQMVGVLGIIIDRRPKGRPRKRESQSIEKIVGVSILQNIHPCKQ